MKIEVRNKKIFIDDELVTTGQSTVKNRFTYLLVGFVAGALSMLGFVIVAQNIAI